MKEFTIENYQKEIIEFNQVTAGEADQLLENKTGEIVYIGFENCPYCRKFVHTLSPLAKEKQLDINYVDAKAKDDTDGIKVFREKYELKTVPGFLYFSKKAGLTVKMDSSLSSDNILKIVEAE